ncbi:MAG: polysaccharide biosynthesis tyrosine autokinase [Actinomycetota bacterium]|nr:polysaccharide biosynthesis tyrosine autokinase [Actinomycetota bacterium]
MSLSQFDTHANQMEGFDIQQYMAVIRSRKWLIVWVTALVVIVALAYSYQQKPVYDSEAQVLVKPLAQSGDQTDFVTLNLETEVLIATSPEVAQLAGEDLRVTDGGELLRGLEVVSAQDTEVLLFRYSHSNAEVAQERAQAFAQAYVDHRAENAQGNLDLRTKLIQTTIATLNEQVRGLNQQVAATSDPIEQARLQEESGLIYSAISLERAKLLDIATLSNQELGRVLYPGYLPIRPSSPNHSKTGAIALLAGLALAVGAAFLKERLDDRLDGRAGLESIFGASVLAVVPRSTQWRKASEAYLATESDPHSVVSESYRTLRTGLLFAASQREIKTVLITSAQAGEGKTATTANLGVVLAQAGKRVIIVSADLRKPRLNNFFSTRAPKGLTNVLAGECRATEALVPVSAAASNLRLLPSGPIPGNPAELLGSEAMRKLIAELRGAADFVLIDVAPILAVADGMTLAPMVDSVLFIADAAQATGGGIQQARSQLDQVNARVVGAVLNNFDPSKSRGYSVAAPYTHYRHAAESSSKRSSVVPWKKASRGN